MIKLLIGGSPCTFWSIAQKNNRETEAEGMGWELFKNYLIAKEKFKPDFFLYENNKSAAQAIKNQIKHELNVWDETLYTEDTGARYIEINSALVSAQNRQRFYVHNCGDVEQPEDRRILLRDILETTTSENAYSLSEPVGTTKDGKSFALTAYYSTGQNVPHTITKHKGSMVAEPIYVGEVPGHNGQYRNGKQPSQQYRVYSADGKSVAVDQDSRKYIAEPVRIPDYGMPNKSRPVTASYAYKGSGEGSLVSEAFPDNPNKQVRDYVAEPVRIGTIESEAQNKAHDSKQYRVYSPDGKSTTLCGQGGGVGAKTGLYAVPCDGEKAKPIYEVKNGLITIKDKQYPIKLADGLYIIRKLTVTECCRLQTMPDDYCKAVSNSQAYKGLGNGWTAEVIIHILNGALKDVPRDEEIVVLSMYDGIGTGRYCLDKMGFTNVKYYAYEIDKYAKQIAMSNYPDIIQCGDAFELRNPDWTIGY